MIGLFSAHSRAHEVAVAEFAPCRLLRGQTHCGSCANPGPRGTIVMSSMNQAGWTASRAPDSRRHIGHHYYGQQDYGQQSKVSEPSK